MINPSLFLRRAILLDAIVSGAMGLLMTLGASMLASLLDLPDALLRETGLFYIAYTAVVGWLGMQQLMPKVLVLVLIAGNAIWGVACLVFLFGGLVSPNSLGQVFIAMQSIAVGAFAELQYIGLRRSGGAVTA